MTTKITCSCCGKLRPRASRKGLQCKDCLNAKQRRYRSLTRNSVTKKYEKTKKGYLMRTYRNMLSRVTGVLKEKAHLYYGLEILDKDAFYAWSLADENFHTLFEEWEASNYDRRLSPSVDRINSFHGYTLINMEWVTHSENSRRINRVYK